MLHSYSLQRAGLSGRAHVRPDHEHLKGITIGNCSSSDMPELTQQRNCCPTIALSRSFRAGNEGQGSRMPRRTAQKKTLERQEGASSAGGRVRRERMTDTLRIIKPNLRNILIPSYLVLGRTCASKLDAIAIPNERESNPRPGQVKRLGSRIPSERWPTPRRHRVPSPLIYVARAQAE